MQNIIVTLILLVLIIGLAVYIKKLTSTINLLSLDLEYLRYTINCTNWTLYSITRVINGELTVEEEFKLALIQDEISEDSFRLGLDDPFERPLDVSQD